MRARTGDDFHLDPTTRLVEMQHNYETALLAQAHAAEAHSMAALYRDATRGEDRDLDLATYWQNVARHNYTRARSFTYVLHAQEAIWAADSTIHEVVSQP